jgi:anti-sigma B factor antagonist
MGQEEVLAVSLTIEVTAGYRSITFAIRGDLDLATAPDLAKAMAAIRDSYGRLVVDLSELDFIDSSGVRVLVQGQKHLADQGVKLELARVARQAEKVFQLLGISDWQRNEDILRRISTEAPQVAPQARPHVR